MSNDSGKLLVENCRKININDFLRQYRTELKQAFLLSKIKTIGTDIELGTSRTGFGGVRFWFKCPFCNRRVGILYKHPINNDLGCRRCLNLEYRSRLYKGMIENRIAS